MMMITIPTIQQIGIIQPTITHVPTVPIDPYPCVPPPPPPLLILQESHDTMKMTTTAIEEIEIDLEILIDPLVVDPENDLVIKKILMMTVPIIYNETLIGMGINYTSMMVLVILLGRV